MSFKLYSPFGNQRGNLVRITADICELNYEYNDLDHTLGASPGPLIETQNGCIAQTNAILRYIS